MVVVCVVDGVSSLTAWGCDCSSGTALMDTTCQRPSTVRIDSGYASEVRV